MKTITFEILVNPENIDNVKKGYEAYKESRPGTAVKMKVITNPDTYGNDYLVKFSGFVSVSGVYYFGKCMERYEY